MFLKTFTNFHKAVLRQFIIQNCKPPNASLSGESIISLQAQRLSFKYRNTYRVVQNNGDYYYIVKNKHRRISSKQLGFKEPSVGQNMTKFNVQHFS